MKSAWILAAACLLFSSPQTVFAQGGGLDFSAGRKITGSYYQPYAARAYQWNAINQGRVLQYYSQTNKAIPAETAQALATDIKRNVTAADAEMAKLAQEAKNNPEAMKLITEIQTHHANALKECGMMDAECAKHQGGSVQMPDCCTRMQKELDAAAAAHDKLLKYLKVPAPEATK